MKKTWSLGIVSFACLVIFTACMNAHSKDYPPIDMYSLSEDVQNNLEKIKKTDFSDSGGMTRDELSASIQSRCTHTSSTPTYKAVDDGHRLRCSSCGTLLGFTLAHTPDEFKKTANRSIGDGYLRFYEAKCTVCKTTVETRFEYCRHLEYTWRQSPQSKKYLKLCIPCKMTFGEAYDSISEGEAS